MPKTIHPWFVEYGKTLPKATIAKAATTKSKPQSKPQSKPKSKPKPPLPKAALSLNNTKQATTTSTIQMPTKLPDDALPRNKLVYIGETPEGKHCYRKIATPADKKVKININSIAQKLHKTMEDKKEEGDEQSDDEDDDDKQSDDDEDDDDKQSDDDDDDDDKQSDDDEDDEEEEDALSSKCYEALKKEPLANLKKMAVARGLQGTRLMSKDDIIVKLLQPLYAQ